MKIKINIKSIIFMTVITIASLLFINISFAANTGKIIVETAKLREQPNTDSKVLELASQGETVEILEKTEGWYKVKYKKITGYIRTDLIETENKETSNAKNNTESTETTENTATENTTMANTATENETVENTAIENTATETNTESAEEKIVEKGKYKISENIKLKIIPLISAIELNEVNKDAEVEVTEILNNWAKIKTSEGKEGWVRVEKLASIQENKTQQPTQQPAQEQTQQPTQPVENTTKTMYVNSQTVNVRQKADKTSQVIKQLTINAKVTVLSSENGWAYVDIDGTKGYIAENLLSSTKKETSRSSMTSREAASTTTNTEKAENITTNNTANSTTSNANTNTSLTGNSVVTYAKQFLGCKYVYGGTTPKGFDCSGFTQYVYKHFGVNLNRTAAAQYSNGKSVTNLQAGDLVMFGKSGINHVGIYIGGNSFIHAENPSSGVTIDSLSSGYYKKNYVGARRIF